MSKDTPEVGDVWEYKYKEFETKYYVSAKNILDVLCVKYNKINISMFYEQWKDLKSKLQLKDTAYDFDTARLEEENAQLKELLKECKTPLEVYNEMFGNKEELLTKIDEVLK